MAALGVVGLTAPAQAATHSATLASASHKSPVQPDAVDAVAAAERAAKASGKPVVIPSMTTATTQTAANPKGGFILVESAAPVRVFKSGHWAAIDATLHRNANGTFSPAAVANDVYLSGGGTTPLATVVHDGRTLSVTWPTALPKPHITDDTATYPEVLPGVDLKVTADTQGGFSEVLAVKTAQAAANPALRTLTLATTTPGQTLSADAQGNLVTRDRHGAPVFFAPAPTMWDSTTATPAPHSADQSNGLTFRQADPGAHKARVVTRLLTGHRVALTPDAGMLGDKHTHFPVFIDPNWDVFNTTNPGYFEAQQGCPTSNTSYDSTTYETYGDGVGYNGWSGCLGIEQTYVQFALPSSVYGTDIPSGGATLKMAEEYSASPSLSATVGAYQASSTFGSGADWNNRPGYGSSALSSHSVGPVTSTSAPTVGFDVTSAVRNAKQGATIAFAIRGDENSGDRDYFKRFYVKGTGTVPNLVIQYNAYPKVASGYTSPGTTCSTPSAPPFSTIGNTAITLKAQLTDTDPGQSLTAKFTYSHYNGTQIGSYTTTSSVGNDGVESWSIGTLPSGDYTWTAQAFDGIDWSKAVTTCHFTVDATAPAQPVLSSSAFPNTDQQTPPGVTPVVTDPARTAGGTNDFSFDPNGSTDVAKYAYSWGFAPPTVNPPLTVTATGGTGPTPVTLTPPSTGLNILYVRAIDSVGNISTTVGQLDVWTAYATVPVATDGDYNDDGTPDLISVGTWANPGLWIYEGNTDGTLAAPLQIGDKGTVNGTGNVSDWTGSLIAHGYFSGNPAGNQDLLVRTPNGSPTVYQGTGNTGSDGIFSPDVTSDNHPLTVGLAAPAGGTGTPTPDWQQDRQLVAVGAMQSDYSGSWVYPNDNGPSGTSPAYSPDLWSIQGDALGYYRATTTTAVYNPFTVISASGWSNKTIVSAGIVGGFPALWSRDNSTGELDLWTTTSANIAAGATGSLKTVMASSGYDSYTYPTLADAGDSVPGGCPQLWGVTPGAQTIKLIPCTSLTTLGTPTSTGQSGSVVQSFDGVGAPANLAHSSHDFNGDGIDDMSLWYDYGATGSTCTNVDHVSLITATGNSNYTGALNPFTSKYDNTCFGGGATFVTTGDFNGDGKSDVALFYDYGTNGSTCTGVAHVAVFVYYADANGDGGFQTPVEAWNNTCFGGGTHAMVAGDFDGDGKADLAMLYQYSTTHVAVFTMNPNSDGTFTAPVSKWDNQSWNGSVTNYLAAGDFHGSGRSDLALFSNPSGSHVTIYTLAADANGDGGFQAPVTAWDAATFGGGTQAFVAGDFNGDGKTDVALLYNYGSGHLAIFTMTASSAGNGTLAAPVEEWNDTTWGTGNTLITAGDYHGDGKSDIALFYDWGGTGSTCGGVNHVSISELPADTNGDGGFMPATVAMNNTCFGGGTRFLN